MKQPKRVSVLPLHLHEHFLSSVKIMTGHTHSYWRHRFWKFSLFSSTLYQQSVTPSQGWNLHTDPHTTDPEHSRLEHNYMSFIYFSIKKLMPITLFQRLSSSMLPTDSEYTTQEKQTVTKRFEQNLYKTYICGL